MQIVRMIKTMAGPDGVFPVGQVRTVDDAAAEMLIGAGAAELIAVITPTPPESAAVDPVVETAVQPKAKKRAAR